MENILHRIGELGIVPVVKLDRAEDALPLGRALLEGDLPVAEVTFRTAAAEESIRNLTENLPDLLVGAGTVLTREQVKQAVDAAKLGQDEKLAAIRRLDEQARRLERTATGPSVEALIAKERARSHDYGGRSVFGWEPPAGGEQAKAS